MSQNSVTLTNFSFTATNPVVGQIVSAKGGADLPKAQLIGEGARLFRIGKGNILKAKKALAKNSSVKHQEVVIESVTAKGETKRDTFRIVRDEFIRNQVIAHRGAWKNTKATENSLAALQHAIQLGCAGSEFDVHMSLDSVVFVYHDHSIKGINIEKTPAVDLGKLKLGNGEFLPTLDAYLQLGLAQNKVRLILEIKPSAISKERGQALAQKVVELVKKHKAQGWVDYISFDYNILKKVQELEPYAKVAYLNGEKAPSELAKSGMYGFDYNYNIIKGKPQWIEQAHQHGLTVNVWTVNSPELMDWFLERKADFITTNEPELLLEKVNKLKLK